MTDIGTHLDGFESMGARLVDERTDRIARASKRLKFYVPFLDDYLRGILPNDLVLIGAPSGVGKTDLALGIACSNAFQKRRVHYFALEAEPRELERRTKYALVSKRAYRDHHPQRQSLNYTDWLLGDLEYIVGPYNHEADAQVMDLLGGMQTYYRGARFTSSHLDKAIQAIHQRSELIVIDHLHYIDSDDDDKNEHRALGDTVKTIRDISLRIGVPIILVAHMRKRDQRARQLVADLDDFHGSSNVTKISTQVIAIEPARGVESPKWFLSPTYMTIPKDRRSGRCRNVAVTYFDHRTRGYSDTYSLGVAKAAEWEQIGDGDVPSWAKRHRRMETA